MATKKDLHELTLEEDVDIIHLLEYLVPFKWQRECKIFQRETKNTPRGYKWVVMHVPTKLFLRHSGGPLTGIFWDIYGDDFLSKELALVELSKAHDPNSVKAVK